MTLGPTPIKVLRGVIADLKLDVSESQKYAKTYEEDAAAHTTRINALEKLLNSHDALLAACESFVELAETLTLTADGYVIFSLADALKDDLPKIKAAIAQATKEE